MAANHALELEEALTGERRGLRSHGESVPDRHDTHFRSIDLVDEPHVGKDCRVAHVVNGLALTGGDDESATSAEIDRPPLVEDAGGVPGGEEGEIEILVVERAIGVAGIDFINP